jgi:hypothetical protein
VEKPIKSEKNDEGQYIKYNNQDSNINKFSNSFNSENNVNLSNISI